MAMGVTGNLVNVRYATTEEGLLYSYHTDRSGRRIDAYSDQLRMDAGETIFMSEQLTSLEAAISEVSRPKLDGFDLCPINTSHLSWMQSLSYRSATSSGKAGFVGSEGRNIPQVSVGIGRENSPFLRFAIGAHWTLDEIQASMALNMNLDSSYTVEAQEAGDSFINEGIITGYPDDELSGFFGDKDVPKRKSANTFDSDSSAADILAELNAVVNEVVQNSKGAEIPNRLAIALVSYHYIATTPWSATAGDTTILQHFVGNNPYITSIEQVFPMANLEGMRLSSTLSSVNVMVAYNFSPAKVEIGVSPMVAMAVQEHTFTREMVWSGKLSKVMWKKPKSAQIRHSI